MALYMTINAVANGVKMPIETLKTSTFRLLSMMPKNESASGPWL